MPKNFNTNTKNHDEWITPQYITDTLGPFDLDPCSPGERRPWDTARVHIGLPQDGLSISWEGRVWCNPPYGRETFKWLEKLADHGSGMALVFARTETKGFHAQVWEKADSVFFFEGRLKFCKIDGSTADTANAPSCIVSYSERDSMKIATAIACGKLKGRLIFTRKLRPACKGCNR